MISIDRISENLSKFNGLFFITRNKFGSQRGPDNLGHTRNWDLGCAVAFTDPKGFTSWMHLVFYKLVHDSNEYKLKLESVLKI